MIRLATGMSLLFALTAIGCGGRGNVDLLEGRLREQEDRLSAVQSQLEEARSELTVAHGESRTLRTQLASQGKPAILPERAEALFRATGLKFNQLFTGGLDRDGHQGDELLIATLVPHDAQGEMVKLPGQIQLEVFDLAQSGEKRKIGHWSFDTEQATKHWHRGYLASGYMFRLPWQHVPKHSRLLLHAQLTTADGRQFDATREVQIAPSTETLADNPAQPLLETASPSPTPFPLRLNAPPDNGGSIDGSNGDSVNGDSNQAPVFPDAPVSHRPENPFSDKQPTGGKQSTEQFTKLAKSNGTQHSPRLTRKLAVVPRRLPTPNIPIERLPIKIGDAKFGDAKPDTNSSRIQSSRPEKVLPPKQGVGPQPFRRSAPPLQTSDNFTERTEPAYH